MTSGALTPPPSLLSLCPFFPCRHFYGCSSRIDLVTHFALSLLSLCLLLQTPDHILYFLDPFLFRVLTPSFFDVFHFGGFHAFSIDMTSPCLDSAPTSHHVIEWALDHFSLLPLLFPPPLFLYLARRTSFPPWVLQTPV